MTGNHDDAYPPRWRRNATGETAKAAALHMKPKAPRLRDRVLSVVEAKPSTPEEVQILLEAEGVFHLVSAIRPRFTELKAMGMVRDSGARRIGESGRCKSVVWRATTAEERQQVAGHGERGSAKGK
jgi:hypothetical protein